MAKVKRFEVTLVVDVRADTTADELMDAVGSCMQSADLTDCIGRWRVVSAIPVPPKKKV